MKATPNFNRDTILDRTKLMEDAKKRKPWNMISAERERERDEVVHGSLPNLAFGCERLDMGYLKVKD